MQEREVHDQNFKMTLESALARPGMNNIFKPIVKKTELWETTKQCCLEKFISHPFFNSLLLLDFEVTIRKAPYND